MLQLIIAGLVLASFVGLQTVTGEVTSRPDVVVAELKSAEFDRDEGNWSEMRYCDVGFFATGIALKFQGHKGAGSGGPNDDTSTNGIRLHCDDGNMVYAGNDGSDGSYTEHAGDCPDGTAISGFKTCVEPNRGGGMTLESNDDTAVGDMRIYCSNNTEITFDTWFEGAWATDVSKCPSGSSVCGFKQKVYAPGNSDDDTGLNAVRLACCSSPSIFSGATGYWKAIYRTNVEGMMKYQMTLGIETYFEESLSSTDEVALTASMSAEMSYKNGAVGSELSTVASTAITTGTLASVLTTETSLMVVNCPFVALFQYMTDDSRNAYNADTSVFTIQATDYWCSQSIDVPLCPLAYCLNTTYCQECKDGLYASESASQTKTEI